MTTKSAVIVGNGLSRKGVNLAFFREYGEIYGANAIYRDFKVDWLVAIDDRIIGEVLESAFPRNRFIVPPMDEQFEPSAYSPFRRRENAGMVAMREAIKKGNKRLYCLGFDFLFEDPQMNMGNIYDGTNAYGPETRASVEDCANRMLYLDWFADKNPSVEFIFLYPDTEQSRKIRSANSSNLKVSFFQISS